MLPLFRLMILLTCFTVLCLGLWPSSSSVLAQAPDEESKTAADQPALQRPEILKRQTRLARQYELLEEKLFTLYGFCLLYTSPSPRDKRQSRMPSSA